MESIPKKGYFAKELALRTLFGDKAFADLKKLMDPCCGPGVDGLCTEPCGSTPTEMCPKLTIASVTIDCINNICSLELQATDNADNTLCGIIEYGITPPPPAPDVTLWIRTDTFCITGNTTTTVNIPGLCTLLSGEGIFELGLLQYTGDVLAVSPQGPASQIFPNAQISFNCPIINICPGSPLKDCVLISCVDGNFQMSIQLGTFGVSSTLIVQTSPSVGPEVWTDLGTISSTPYITTHTETLDASTLVAGETYKVRLVDSLDNSITSDTVFVTAPAPC